MDTTPDPDPARQLLELELERSLHQRAASDDEESQRIDSDTLGAVAQVAERNHLLSQARSPDGDA